MCTFVTLIAATDDLDRLAAILASRDRRGQMRRAERVDTPGLRQLLTPGEREYWLVRAPCDCGTFLGHARPRGPDPAALRAADIVRYRRKGWSDARIARAMIDKDRTGARPGRHPPNEDAAYWIDLMTALADGLGLTRLGLMHHFYAAAPGVEPETATRADAGPLEHAAEVLAHMADGVIHDFHATPRRRRADRCARRALPWEPS